MLSAIVITKNEEAMIGDCLKSLQFANEIIVVDTGNTDKTNEIAKKFKAKIAKSSGSDYSQFRNDGAKAAKGDWILYVDADERVSPELKREIQDILHEAPSEAGVFALPRKNYYLGKLLVHGGWGSDYVIRLFRKKSLARWVGALHEQPEYKGELIKLGHFLIHHSHRGLYSMTEKTLSFTGYEAELRLENGHPPMSWWRFFRVMFTEFWLRFVKLGAWKDGTEGIIDGLFQVYNSFIIYARLWELQHEKSRNL